MSNKIKSLKSQPFIKKGRFYNSTNEIGTNIFSEYACMFGSFVHEVAIFLQSLTRSGKSENPLKWYEKSKVNSFSVEPSITWIGHATFLIQIDGFNILTDPIFGNATPFFPRILPPGIFLENLPVIDYVVISHNHRDHMDEMSLISLKKLNPEIKILVPNGDKNWFEKRGFNNIYENFWWEQLEFKNNDGNRKIKFTFLPAHHWSQRTLFDHNKSIWGSWMIESDSGTIYFAGDTAYSNHFNLICNEFPNIDIALMPIGPCEPREKMCHSHIGPEESGQAFLDLKAKNFIPMHWGTFYFGTDSFEIPIERIKNWWNLNYLDFKKLHLIKIGQKIEFKYSDFAGKLTQNSNNLVQLNK